MAERKVAALKAGVQIKAATAFLVTDAIMAGVLFPLPDVVNEMETEGAEAIDEDVVLADITLIENDDSVMEILMVSLHVLCIHE